MSPHLRLADVIDAVEGLYPVDTAQSWDRVGLVSGDRAQPVRRILLAVDPTAAVLAQAIDTGADMVITHHPLLLRGVHSVATDTAKGAAVTALIRSGVALYCAHTNADVADLAAGGVGHALAAACGLDATDELQLSEGHELGRVGTLAEPVALRALAERIAAAVPATGGGVRVAGPADELVQRVAVLGGAGDTAFDAVRASGADVYVTADLRHHPALEAREEARNSAPDGVPPEQGRPFLIDAGHFASEWLWLPVLAERLGRVLGQRATVEVSRISTDPWDFVVSTGGSGQ